MPFHSFNQTIGLPEISDSPFFTADWPCPPNVRTLVSTRHGGTSRGAYASLNVGAHVGDRPEDVARNRAIVQAQVPLPLAYLNQVHGTAVVQAAEAAAAPVPPDADASVDSSGRAACAVMTADCLPVLFCDRAGSVVAAAHAGWRGLAGGILQQTAAAMRVPPVEIMAWFGPAIGPEAFEVGGEVRETFCRSSSRAEDAFTPIGGGKYLADIYLLAEQILHSEGITQTYGGGRCTVLERDSFFSYRRNAQTGRMVSAVWLKPENTEAA